VEPSESPSYLLATFVFTKSLCQPLAVGFALPSAPTSYTALKPV